MAMIQGSVSIDPVTAVVTGAGLAREIFDALIATIDFQGLDEVGKEPQFAAAMQGSADLANSFSLIVPHIVANAVVSATSAIALGSTANGVTAGGVNVPVTGSATTSNGTIA